MHQEPHQERHLRGVRCEGVHFGEGVRSVKGGDNPGSRQLQSVSRLRAKVFGDKSVCQERGCDGLIAERNYNAGSVRDGQRGYCSFHQQEGSEARGGTAQTEGLITRRWLLQPPATGQAAGARLNRPPPPTGQAAGTGLNQPPPPTGQAAGDGLNQTGYGDDAMSFQFICKCHDHQPTCPLVKSHIFPASNSLHDGN